LFDALISFSFFFLEGRENPPLGFSQFFPLGTEIVSPVPLAFPRGRPPIQALTVSKTPPFSRLLIYGLEAIELFWFSKSPPQAEFGLCLLSLCPSLWSFLECSDELMCNSSRLLSDLSLFSFLLPDFPSRFEALESVTPIGSPAGFLEMTMVPGFLFSPSRVESLFLPFKRPFLISLHSRQNVGSPSFRIETPILELFLFPCSPSDTLPILVSF